MSATPTVQKVQGYGWRKDRPDPRDRIYNLQARILRADQVPGNFDLEDEMPPVYNQLQLGSCTANATGAIMQHCQMKEGEAEGSNVPSRLFIYYNERKIEGQPLDQDTGAEVRDGIKVLASMGAPPESEWPYSDANPGPFQQAPPASAYTDALKYEAIEYQRIVIVPTGDPYAPMRTAIVNHQPIAFGFPVPALFEDRSWNPATTPLPLPTASTQYIGGHAVVVVGFDFDGSKWGFPFPVFKVRNSWDTNWGLRGHFYMHFEWFTPGANLADDLWVVSKAS